MSQYILALDQGTTSSRAIVFDKQGGIVGRGQYPFTQHYPLAGWVEHDPMEIWASERRALAEITSHIDPRQVAAIGITNQRETTILWDRRTGEPIHNAIVWQCRRTAPFCDELKARGLGEIIAEKTGLLIDAYFSASKIRWLLDNVPGARERAERGELCFGTVDSWLIWQLSGGAVHVTDYSNASRTMLFNIHTLRWDEELCARLGVPMSMLPTPVPSSMVSSHFWAASFSSGRAHSMARSSRVLSASWLRMAFWPRYMPRPCSALSSKRELDQAGPWPSLLVQ